MLHEFASQVIEGKLSLSQFGLEPPSQGGGSPKPPEGYIAAAAKAWNIIIYQALFAIPEGDAPGTPAHRAYQFGHLSGSIEL